jgi:hypothetical protein
MSTENNSIANRKDHLGRTNLQKFMRNQFDNEILSKIEILIGKAKEFGLPQMDVGNAEISLDYNEFEVSYDTVVEQLYEHNIIIDNEFYNLAMEICKILNLQKDKYQFLKEIIKVS